MRPGTSMRRDAAFMATALPLKELCVGWFIMHVISVGMKTWLSVQWHVTIACRGKFCIEVHQSWTPRQRLEFAIVLV